MKNTQSLKENRDFRRLYHRGKSYSDKYISVYMSKSRLPLNRLGLTVSTKIGKAVVRNSIKRKFREIYRLHELEFPYNIDMVMVARSAVLTADFKTLENSYKKALKRVFSPDAKKKPVKKPPAGKVGL